ncbi:alpha-galactosidase [Vibrio sp. SCSIO 43135]|uniref:glycoside hydrolase family 36 protein n=1 Tax=Vibrio sp. SCSIO 43135 TaxID=2819096 RepID=UPI002075835B|nr:alpha-galactosidase [Vibrio sp. SCSIO 43135]USD40170.1 alpha-galactosidase [Vibrio sp. SCSIO 43135]
MSHTIHLPCHRDIVVVNPDLLDEVQGNEVTFRYIGLHNHPIPSDYQLFTCEFDFEHSATLLGDGFQMLAQTTGTFEQPVDIGRCPDNSPSYRIYGRQQNKRYYNYLVVEDSVGYTLFGFTSCSRFAGYFEVSQEEHSVQISANIDGEDTYPLDWDSTELESVVVLNGESLSGLYQRYSDLISQRHPPRAGVESKAPIGWCSWYAYYADVNEDNIRQNLEVMSGDLSNLEWVLLDDGYQAFMGDWLTPSDKFSGGVKELISDIKRKGKKPAIWLAPFIAQPESKVFKQHPNWFVRHPNGELLKAEDVTYGGWRCTPWYVLDTSHPEVQEHLTHVVRVMREEWGVELFKLDANYWGTLKGKRHVSGVTGVQAYRLGMEAIAEGVKDAWLLGCNAPMWPSLGLVDAMRVSDDVERNPKRFEQIAKETFYRSWQHRKLWQIDPDCATFVSLANQATDRSNYEFHRNTLLTCGGLLLSGDPLPELTPFAKTALSKLMLRQRHNQNAARFTSLSLHHAFLELTDRNQLHCLFNYHEDAKEVTLTSDHPVYWYDYWTGEKLTEEPVQVVEIPLEAGLTSRAIITSP